MEGRSLSRLGRMVDMGALKEGGEKSQSLILSQSGREN
jgi:hypothetical protein